MKGLGAMLQENQGHHTGRRLSTLLATVATKGLKRVGSATNLAPPGGPQANLGGSVSLPPSPQHSPSPSRKVNGDDNDNHNCNSNHNTSSYNNNREGGDLNGDLS